MIEIRNLQKRYGEIDALRGISTAIGRGEVVGLLGPNGAGKTTAMKILVGYLLPTAGSARVAGHSVVDEPLEVQRRIGYLPENAPLYLDMLVQEYLEFMAAMRELAPREARQSIGVAVDECGIRSVLTRSIGHLSKGFRQRVGLASAILHDPEILILDEPTTGLDPNQIVEVRGLIRKMGESKTVILSTHILQEVEATCSRAVILIDGSIRADGTLSELTQSRAQVVSVAAPDAGDAAQAFGGLPGVSTVERAATNGRFVTFRLNLDGDVDVAEAVANLSYERRWPLRELRRDDKTMEQVFRELTDAHAAVSS
jgi:ABC-2 type transport system ATP-binding protein